MKESDKKNLKLLIRHLKTNIATEDLIKFVAISDGMLQACQNIVKTEKGDALWDWFRQACNQEGVRPENIVFHLQRVLQIFSPSSEDDNDYSILCLEPGASLDEIKRAFRRLSVKHHPDMTGEDKEQATEKFIKICQAYKRLSQASTRSGKLNQQETKSPWIYKKEQVRSGTAKFRHFIPLAVLAIFLLFFTFVAPTLYERHVISSRFSSQEPKKSLVKAKTPMKVTPVKKPIKMASLERTDGFPKNTFRAFPEENKTEYIKKSLKVKDSNCDLQKPDISVPRVMVVHKETDEAKKIVKTLAKPHILLAKADADTAEPSTETPAEKAQPQKATPVMQKSRQPKDEASIQVNGNKNHKTASTPGKTTREKHEYGNRAQDKKDLAALPSSKVTAQKKQLPKKKIVKTLAKPHILLAKADADTAEPSTETPAEKAQPQKATPVMQKSRQPKDEASIQVNGNKNHKTASTPGKTTREKHEYGNRAQDKKDLAALPSSKVTAQKKQLPKKENEEMARRLNLDLLRARILYFVKNFCKTYAKRDFNKFAQMFSQDAFENGKSFTSLRPEYERLFKKVNMIDLTIIPDGWKTNNNMVKMHGHFNLYLQYYSGRKRNLSGLISMLLRDRSNSFKVKELTYKFDQ